MAFGNFRPGFSIFRASKTSDGSGGTTTTFVDTNQTVSGRLSVVSSNQVTLAGQETSRATHTFSCAASVILHEEDEVRTPDGRIARVLSVMTTSNFRRKQARCVVDETGA